MNDDKKDQPCNSAEEGRRVLLKKLSVGGSSAAIAKWTAPVISALVIPAHAQTSFGMAFSAVVFVSPSPNPSPSPSPS